MKVTYEFDPYEDRDELHLTEIRHNMLSGLNALRALSRSIYKGWDNWEDLTKEAFVDRLLDEIHDIIIESKVDEIE